MIEQINLYDLAVISIKAGHKILKVYDSDFSVESKEDQSPLTLADKKSHEVICAELGRLYPTIPILSEEGNHVSYEERMKWDYLWVVDPLDGTKEFVRRNGEFTVNIALVHKGHPVVGIIYAPVLDALYFSKEGVGAYKIEGMRNLAITNELELIYTSTLLPCHENSDHKAIVGSRSHMSAETEEYITKVKEKYGEVSITSAGSSLKLCLVAEGKADVYPRFAPTMEWDTAAGHAIVAQSGGKVIKVDANEALSYNKQDLLNPWFIALRAGFTV